MSSAFTNIGIALLLSYAASFYWLFKSVGLEQSEKYNATFSDRRKINIIGVTLLIFTFLLSNLILASVFFAASIAWIFLGTYKQRSKMMLVGFDPIFVNKLFRISFLIFVSIGSLFAGKVLESI